MTNIKNKKYHPYRQKLTFGQRMADKLTGFCGSWTFITLSVIFLITWVLINTTMLLFRWDPYPFILLNLFLSCLAALQAPIILMSQNRSAERDRAKAERDFAVNRKAEREIEDVQRDLEEIKELVRNIKNGGMQLSGNQG